jgi:hypothetical protein
VRCIFVVFLDGTVQDTTHHTTLPHRAPDVCHVDSQLQLMHTGTIPAAVSLDWTHFTTSLTNMVWTPSPMLATSMLNLLGQDNNPLQRGSNLPMMLAARANDAKRITNHVATVTFIRKGALMSAIQSLPSSLAHTNAVDTTVKVA